MSFRTTISWLLLPLTMWYAIGVAVRNMLYAIGFKKSEAPHITTLGIGNLSTGGSGKTPMSEYLLDLLSPHYRTAFLSRGYKRHSKGFLLDDGSHNTTLLGDEPAMVAAKHPDVQVAVCEKRVEGVRRLMEQEETPQVIVMDDVFQHRQIKPSISLLLTEYHHPLFRDHILPYGNLREFRSARYRAGIVVVTKCPEHLNPIDKHNIIAELKLQNFQKVFFSYLQYDALHTLDGRPADIALHEVDNVLAVTGIAHPEPLLDHLRHTCKVQHLAYPDHHVFSRRDIAHIRADFEAIASSRKIIITTEKDATRLQGLTEGLPVYTLPVKIAFHNSNDMDFAKIIESSVRENISFLSKLSIWS